MAACRTDCDLKSTWRLELFQLIVLTEHGFLFFWQTWIIGISHFLSITAQNRHLLWHPVAQSTRSGASHKLITAQIRTRTLSKCSKHQIMHLIICTTGGSWPLSTARCPNCFSHWLRLRPFRHDINDIKRTFHVGCRMSKRLTQAIFK